MLKATSLCLHLALKMLNGVVASEIESEWMKPLLIEVERERLVASQLSACV